MKRLLGVMLVLLPTYVQAQNIANVKKLSQAEYSLQIDGVNYRAIKTKTYQAIVKRLTDDDKLVANLAAKIKSLETQLKLSQANAAKYQEALTAQQDLNKQYQQLNDSYSKLNEKYSETAGKLVELNKNYSTTLDQFDELVGKYRKVALRSNPRNKLDLGLGVLKPTASGEDPHYFAMIGSGVTLLNTEIRGWVLVGNNSYGAMVGMSF